MTKLKFGLFTALLCLGVGSTLAADESADPGIAIDRVQQRYPWNGYIDIDVTVSNLTDKAAEYCIELKAEKVKGGTYAIRTLLDYSNATNPVSGSYRLTWDAVADGVVVFDQKIDITARLIHYYGHPQYNPYGGSYMIIDLAKSSDNISYLNLNPDNTNYFNQSDEYKTDKIALRLIKAGTFTMGARDEDSDLTPSGQPLKETQHQVTLTQDFYLGVFPVTYQQWSKINDNTDAAANSTLPKREIWYGSIRGDSDGKNVSKLADRTVDASSFMGRLRSHTGNVYKFDLPTEAQWEYACRAGTEGVFYFDLPAAWADLSNRSVWPNGALANADLQNFLANYFTINQFSTVCLSVGSTLPNPWGLFDLLGNVREYCLDLMSEADKDADCDLGTADQTDPLTCSSNQWYIVRGAYAGRSGMDWRHARPASRQTDAVDGNGNWYYQDSGFRISATLE